MCAGQIGTAVLRNIARAAKEALNAKATELKETFYYMRDVFEATQSSIAKEADAAREIIDRNFTEAAAKAGNDWIKALHSYPPGWLQVGSTAGRFVDYFVKSFGP